VFLIDFNRAKIWIVPEIIFEKINLEFFFKKPVKIS